MLIAVLLLFSNIHIYKIRKDIRAAGLNSYIEACCVWMLFLFVLTEGLSVFHAVRFMALFAAWVGLDIVLAVLCMIQWKQSKLSIRELYGTQNLRGYSYYGLSLIHI